MFVVGELQDFRIKADLKSVSSHIFFSNPVDLYGVCVVGEGQRQELRFVVTREGTAVTMPPGSGHKGKDKEKETFKCESVVESCWRSCVLLT